MNPYLKPSQKNTNPPYDDATINKFNAASSSALGYLQNRLNDPIYYKRLQNEITQSNKLGNVTYDTKTGALDLLNQRKKGLNEVKFINPNTTDQFEKEVIDKIVDQNSLAAFTTGKIGRYEPEYQKEGFMKGALKQDIAEYTHNVIGANPIIFNPEYNNYMDNLLLHEAEHSTQTPYPGYVNPYYEVGRLNVENGSLPVYRNVSNITPYAYNVIKDNIYSNEKYYSDPQEIMSSKRQIEHLFETAPEGTFKKPWKYGDEIEDEHFNYFLNDKNKVQSHILKQALLNYDDYNKMTDEQKKDIKTRFSNIMTKIAYNENNNDNIYTARFGTKVKGKNTNPYLKKYGPGGETDPYDPTTSYIRPKKVIVDGKEMSTYSNEYRDLYNSGTVLPVYEGLPAVYAPEVEVTAEAPEWLKEKRRIEAQGRVAAAVRKGTGSFARPILDTGLEMSGVAGAVRFAQDPIKNLQGTANVLSYTNAPGLIGHGIDYARGNPFFNVTEEDWQGFANTADVAGLATLGAGTAFKMAPKAISSIPRMLGKIPSVNPNIGLRFADEAIEANKALSTRQRQVVPQTTQSIPKEYTPWTQQEMPGLHLKSTMTDGAIAKIVEPKTGLINVEQALGIIGKESGGADKIALIKQAFGESIPKKMDYNDFRKTVQEQLIPLERQFSSVKSNYGIDRLGYQYGEVNENIGGTFNVYGNSKKFKTREEAEEFIKLNSPIENQTLILGNKNKFGKGSSAHSNPDETLGHIHFLRDAETPDVLTVTQIQSDAFQGTHRTMPKNIQESIKNLKSLENQIKMFGFWDEAKDTKQLNFLKAEVENFTQKSLLDKNHQERYLQELVDYAAKRGDVNKIRVPTSETAAKVQGYQKSIPTQLDNNLQPVGGGKYTPKEQTILKKYSEQPNTIKKLFGVEPKIVTDSKGNTWYEFDIPDSFKKGKAEIKAFSMPGIIGTGAAGVGINEMMKQPKEKFRTGGTVNPYLSYNNGGKVIIDGKEVNIDSSEYRKLYESGNLMNVDKDGIPVRWSGEEAVVTAKLTDEEKRNIKKKQEAMYNTIQSGLEAGLQDGFDNQGNPILLKKGKGGIDAAMRSMLYEGIPELTGIPSLVRVLKDPMGHLNSALRTMDGLSTFGTMPYGSYNTPEDVSKTLDVVGAAGTVMPLAKAAKVPFFKVPKVNPNIGLRFADQSINASKALPDNTIYLTEKIKRPLKSMDGDIVTDSKGYKINTVETQKFIENQGNKIIDETINTPEGRKRLAAQFKQEDPWLTNAEIDNLVETRIAETKAAITHNEPRYWNDIRTDQSFVDDRVKQYWFNRIFPYNNAYYTSKNRYYPIHNSNVNTASASTNTNRFIDSNFTPGSISLGRRHEKNLAALDHEMGHAIGHYGELPLDKKLVELVKPKSIPDYLWELATIFNRNDRNYFLKSFNEPYAFLRESRRKMLDNNIINSAYEKIDVDKLLKQRLKNNKDERLIRLTPPWKWKKLAELYNEAPAVIPATIGTGAAGVGLNEIMKQQKQEYRKGGIVNPYLSYKNNGQNQYIMPKYKYGGPVEPVDPEEQLQKTKEYLLSMVNSPLLKERYAASKGKRIEDVTENELAEYKEKISQNINTAKMGDYYKVKPKYKAKEADGFYYPPYTRKEKESGLQDIIDMSKLAISEGEKITDKDVKNLLDFEDNYAHKFFMTKNKYTPGTINHEYSHASTRAYEDLDFKGEAGKYNISEERINKYPDLYKYYKDNEEYNIDPTEQKARIDAVRQWMRENKIYDSTKERFDENHYNLLRENYNNSPESLDESTKEQMMDLLFPYDKTELIRMFNTYTKNINNENNPYLNYSRFGTKISKYNNGGPVDPVDPEEERRLMQERLMRYIRGNNESNNSILDVRSPNEYGFSLGDRFKIQSGLSLDPMTGMPSGYGKLGINNNGFNLGVEKKKGIGTDASIYNIGYEGPKFNIGASYSKENNIPSISGNIGYNNNGINIGVGGNYSPYNKGISANIGYNNNGINAGLNYNYSGQHSISGNIGYGNDIYNVGLSGNVMPGESNVGINATYNLGVRKPQKREEIAMAYNKPIEINLIKEEDDTDADAEQAVGPPEMNYGGYVNPDDPTLPSAPVNLFSNYDMGYNNPFVDDIDSAMNGMMKARMAIESEIGMNPAAKRMTSLYPKEYIFTGDEMFYDEKVNVPAGSIGTHYTTGDANVMFPIIQENKEGNLFFNRYASPMDKEAMRFETPEEASYFGENYKNIAPMMYNQQEYKKGGDAGHSTVEIERSERVYTPDGKLIMETPADAPTHEEGGVKVTLPAGSLVFPKKYYKALDAASGLPEFKKIAKTMLDNAEKAYLRGEPYSSGGKRQ